MRLPTIPFPGAHLAVTVPLLAFCLPASLYAVEAGNIDIHGSVSVTASYSDTYDYLGKTSQKLDLNLVDLVLNGTHRFDNGLRVGAQAYAFKVGSYKDLTLDWANLDYSFTQAFGIRLGRNKVPLGLYNDVQDLDAIRTFASLPLSLYPKIYRAITSSSDGLSLYGNIDLKQAGSLDYQAYGGWKEDIDGSTPFVRGLNTFAEYDIWDVQGGLFGGSVFWNTPLEGLRIGYSYLVSPRNELRGVFNQATQITGDYAVLPLLVDNALGAGTWDNSGRFAGTPVTADVRVEHQIFSAEYTHDKWLFAVEYRLQDNTRGSIAMPALALLGRPTTTAYATYYSYHYGMVTYQATRKLGVGVYYGQENRSRKNAAAARDPVNYTKDWAAALSYAVNDSWTFKIEGHLLNGRALALSSGDDNRANGTDKHWSYWLVKSTFSF